MNKQLELHTNHKEENRKIPPRRGQKNTTIENPKQPNIPSTGKEKQCST